MKEVGAFLQQQQSLSSSPEQAAVWHRLEELYGKKLWHQLTLLLLDFVREPQFATGDGLISLYENFINDFEHRVNPLSLVEIILHVVRQMTDPQVALTFLEKTREKVKSSDEAVILCKTAIGALKLNMGDLQTTKETIECVDEMLKNLAGVTSVHSRFYDLSSKYYQTIGNHASYYRDALRFLGCIDVKDLPVSEQRERAFTLGLAGLMGEGVYNFGELLMHPVLESLRNTERQWLIDTLYAFNSGNVERFRALKTAWGQQPDLAANETLLLKKIQLLCLMEMTFTRPANHRQLTFEEIAASSQVAVNDVELLVMKALSVGLLKGSIDEVDKRVLMTWVQPRVLDLQQALSTPPLPLTTPLIDEPEAEDMEEILHTDTDVDSTNVLEVLRMQHIEENQLALLQAASKLSLPSTRLHTAHEVSSDEPRRRIDGTLSVSDWKRV